MVTLHAAICENEDSDQMVRNIKTRLKQRFSLDHATIEIERGSCADAGPAKAKA
jgi:cobalt-zinc-cadmium efflux system protein